MKNVQNGEFRRADAFSRGLSQFLSATLPKKKRSRSSGNPFPRKFFSEKFSPAAPKSKKRSRGNGSVRREKSHAEPQRGAEKAGAGRESLAKSAKGAEKPLPKIPFSSLPKPLSLKNPFPSVPVRLIRVNSPKKILIQNLRGLCFFANLKPFPKNLLCVLRALCERFPRSRRKKSVPAGTDRRGNALFLRFGSISFPESHGHVSTTFA